MLAMTIERVSVPIWGVFTHVGVKIARLDGSVVVYANAPRRGVIRQSLAEFANGRPVVTQPASTALAPQQVAVRAERAIGSPYRLLTWNCEHFVSWALGNRSGSPQLKAIGAALAAGLVLAHLADR